MCNLILLKLQLHLVVVLGKFDILGIIVCRPLVGILYTLLQPINFTTQAVDNIAQRTYLRFICLGITHTLITA